MIFLIKKGIQLYFITQYVLQCSILLYCYSNIKINIPNIKLSPLKICHLHMKSMLYVLGAVIEILRIMNDNILAPSTFLMTNFAHFNIYI